ncbi:hypothetical protein [Bacillus sp. FSL K6-2971]|uniref:hypothetical protein n=1 Tax=Bacillus sp. FSL K6-2971 TaxID=2921487 RepID=UPI0030FAA44E
MKIGSMSTYESKPCALCNRKTTSYKIYEQSNMQLRIPLCDTKDRKCFDKVDVKDTTTFFLKVIKKDIQEDAK